MAEVLKLLIGLAALACSNVAQAQGTFVYDQQSSTDEIPKPGAGPNIQQFTNYGQTFTPALSSIDFICLKLSDQIPTNGLGVTLLINLRSGPTNGLLLGSTAPVFLQDGFAGTVNFLLPTTVALTPGATYYFEPIVESADQWLIDATEYRYPGGSVFYNGLPADGSDVWFREGVIVPEPISVWLILLAIGIFAWRRRFVSR